MAGSGKKGEGWLPGWVEEEAEGEWGGAGGSGGVGRLEIGGGELEDEVSGGLGGEGDGKVGVGGGRG